MGELPKHPVGLSAEAEPKPGTSESDDETRVDWPKKCRWCILGAVNDANGVGSDDLEFFDGGTELFNQVGFGWSPSRDERYLKSINTTIWHVDEPGDAGIESAKGIDVSFNWTWNEARMLFARADLQQFRVGWLPVALPPPLGPVRHHRQLGRPTGRHALRPDLH